MAMEEKSRNFGELFPGIMKSVMACQFSDGTTKEEKEQIFAALVDVLHRKSVIQMSGNTLKWRSGCMDYLLGILPLLSEDDLRTLLDEENKDSFYTRFCFCPSKKSISLYSRLGRLRPDARYRKVKVSEIYSRYFAVTGLSPYECSGEDIDAFLEAFMDSMDDIDPIRSSKEFD